MTERSRSAFQRLAGVAVAWAAAVVLGAGVLAAQGTTGKIEGTVRDQSGAPINGAQVFIVGTAFAAVSNERGYYFINNVPAGVMVVRAQYIGYQPAEVRNVRVFANQTMTVNATMEQRAIEVTGVTVTVEQTPIVPRDQVTSRTIAGGDVVDALPVDAVREMLRLQPGVVEGRNNQCANPPCLAIRGGRPGEVATYIDGVLVRSLNQASTVAIGTNAVEEASITTGAMGAEYGDAMSGVVNLVTRSGGQRFRGNFAYSSDELAGNVYGIGFNRIEASIGGPLARNLSFFLATTIDGQQNNRRQKGAEDVPLYVLSGADDSVMVGLTPGSATSDSQMVYLPTYERYSDGSRQPLAWTSNLNVDGNVQYTFGSGSRIRLTYHRTGRERMFFPGRQQMYNSASQYGDWNRSDAVILNWNQNLAQSTERALFVEATFSWQKDQWIQSLIAPQWAQDHQTPFMWMSFAKPDFVSNFENFPIDDRLVQNIRVNNCQFGRDDARPAMGGCIPFLNRNDVAGASAYRMNPYGVSSGATYFPTTGVGSRGGPLMSMETRLTGRVNFDWQANRYNRVRFGGDFTRNDVDYFTSGLTNQIFMDAYRESPLRYALFASDRIDLGDVVLDLGLRYEGLDSKISYPRSPGRVYTDPIRNAILQPDGSYAPNYYNQTNILVAYTASDSAMARACAAALTAADTLAWSACNYFTAEPRGALAPSVRVSFPVTDRTGFRLSYAHQLQTPQMLQLATNVSSDLGYTNTNDVFSRDLAFGKTIMFEFGIRHAFSDDMVLDISAYNNDKVSDLAARILPVFDPFRGEMQNINLYTNADFGNTRGVDLRLDRRIGQLFQGTIAYTFQSARGTGSDPNEYLNTISRQISSLTQDRAPPPQAMLRLADSRTHVIAGNLALNFPHGWKSGTLAGALLQDMGVTATFNFASGLPYTRITNTGTGCGGNACGPNNGFGQAYTGTERLNSASMPWVKNVDIRVTRGLRVGGRDLTVFADVRNVFNWTNLQRIFAETGDVTNDMDRDQQVDPIVATLLTEGVNVLETRNGVRGLNLGTSNAECGNYRPDAFWGVPNCVMLQRAEARFGNGDGFLDETEWNRAFTAWYDVNNGPYSFYQPGLNIRLGFEFNF